MRLGAQPRRVERKDEGDFTKVMSNWVTLGRTSAAKSAGLKSKAGWMVGFLRAKGKVRVVGNKYRD